MKHITSTHNEIYKNLLRLASSSKHRKRSGQTLLEGVHLCESYLEQVGRPLMYVYTDNAKETEEVAKIIEVCEAKSVSGVLLGESNFQAISNLEHGTGLIFLVNIPAPTTPIGLAGTALLLEDVQDPGNMGTMLRTAAAAGVTEAYVSSGSVSAWSPKVLRAGMGAHFALRIYENVDLAGVIAGAKVPVLATSLVASQSIYEKDLSQSVAWLFGNEGAGVSKELLSLKVEQVIIPQNPRVESLNVAASAAVCLFEQYRQSNS